MERVQISGQTIALEGVVRWLVGKGRETAEGALSFAHLLVVVPTAQSGRRLRLKLARFCARAHVPPMIRLPAQLVDFGAEASVAVADRTDETVAFWEALGKDASVAEAAGYADLRDILGANALTFADVAARVGGILKGDLADVETARWQRLAELEKSYYAALERRGKVDPIVATQRKLADMRRPEGVEEIVLACVLDPIPILARALEALQLPVTDLVPEAASTVLLDSQIVASGTAAAEAGKIAEIFASVRPSEALPALCVADAEAFPEIRAALEAHGLKVRDPSRTPLATSSLGHLVGQLVELQRTHSYSVFSSFIRTGDARRWIAESLDLSEDALAGLFVELDTRQAELLPERIEDIAPKTKGQLRALFEFVQVKLRKKSVRSLLAALFRSRRLEASDPDAREFAAAAEAVNALLAACFDPSVPEAIRHELFVRRLQEVAYSLEPDADETVVADGWLEIPFLEAREIVVAGFQEGVVPQSVVGHPFLPDALRGPLGLPDNAARAARDRRILALALAGRRPEAVTFCFHSVDAAGDVLKPSRLLFETDDDRILAARAKRLYGLRAGTSEGAAHDLPEGWRLKLPIPPETTHLVKLSPTRLDRYLKCPFTYYLSCKDILGDKRMDDRAEELAAWEFGNMAHEALEKWGRDELRDSTDEKAIAEFLCARVDAGLQERFGTSVPAIVYLQGESVKRRLVHFASVQAARRAEGWRIVAAEKKLSVSYGHTLFSGKCDRIDYRAETDEWCVIDYKTWDSADRAASYDAKKKTWLSLQLPIYCAMLDILDEPEFAAAKRDRISACYCVLGKTQDQVRFTEPLRGELVPDAEKEVARLMTRLEAGVFWPPAAKPEWKWDYEDWLQPSPQESVDPAWIADQERRLAQFGEAVE